MAMKFNNEINLAGAVSITLTLIAAVSVFVTVQAQAAGAIEKVEDLAVKVDENSKVNGQVLVIKNDIKHISNDVEEIRNDIKRLADGLDD